MIYFFANNFLNATTIKNQSAISLYLNHYGTEVLSLHFKDGLPLLTFKTRESWIDDEKTQ